MPYRHINRTLLFIMATTTVSLLWTSRRTAYLPHVQFTLCSSASNTSGSFKSGISSLPQFLGKTSLSWHNDILPIRAIREVFDEQLSTWVSRTTQDYQLLTFSPSNLTVQLALLRLLGISELSLADFGRSKGGKNCFLITLPIPNISTEPCLFVSPEDVFLMIHEFKASKPVLPSFDPTIRNALDHVKPYIKEKAEIAICNGSLGAFYKKIGDASEHELHALCDDLLGQTYQHHHERMFKQLQAAQPLCRTYSTLGSIESCHRSSTPSL